MKKYLRLLIALALPLGVGTLSALLTRDSMAVFSVLEKPPLSPPAWLFPVAWSVLYVLMGLASYLVWTAPRGSGRLRPALGAYLLQLAVNFFWSIIFFSLERYLLAFGWLVLLWALIAITAVRFYRIRKAAGWLMMPYLAWVTFAGYLNFFIWLLNK